VRVPSPDFIKMSRVGVLVIAAMMAASLAVKESPVEKVITLLEELKSEVESEGQNEASTYDTFACFCKSTTEEKASAIQEGQDNIEGEAATLQEQTETVAAKAHELKELDELVASLDKDMAGVVARRESEKAKYEAQAADLAKGIQSIEGAVGSLEEGLGSSFASFRVKVGKQIRKTILIAEALDVSPGAHRVLASLLQEQDAAPSPPPEAAREVSSGSQDILAAIEALEKDFKDRKSTLDAAEGQNSKDFDAVMKTKTSEKNTAEEAIETTKEEKSTAETKTAEASEATVSEEAALKDDEQYLKELTETCELKAREWDQRSQMRADEHAALVKALNIIENKAKDNYDDAGKKHKSLMQENTSPATSQVAAISARRDSEELDFGGVDLSFLQVQTPRKKLRLLASGANALASSETSLYARQDKVIRSLMSKGRRINSPVLTSVAMRIGSDPFQKIKTLVQNLIEKLNEEANDEATKKGWCDVETSKATNDRNRLLDKTMKLDAEIKANQALKAQLTQDIEDLTEEITDFNDSLAKQTKLRNQEKAENMETLDKANAGLAAVKDAKHVLVEFYKKGAKGKVSFLQASGVNDDAPEVHSGAYKGGQEKAGGIVAMLDVIIGDFKKSIKVVTDTEKSAHKAFVEFDRATKTSISEKETAKSQAEIDHKATEQKIVEGFEDLEQTQKMLDDALMTLEDLKPACTDTGMSYADRVEKREEEIHALKTALCELDDQKGEGDCK